MRAVHQVQRARDPMRHIGGVIHHRAVPEVHHGVAVPRARRSEREPLMALGDRQRPRARAAPPLPGGSINAGAVLIESSCFKRRELLGGLRRLNRVRPGSRRVSALRTQC
jgi:hypothetical protein